MAWTLLERIVEAVTQWTASCLIALFLNGIFHKGVKTRMSEKCIVEKCMRPKAAGRRGLCLICYGQAKKKVESGATTWDRLAKLGLCEEDKSPFDSAYDQATEDI